MTQPIDFHTHRPDATWALISVDPRYFAPEPGKWYSVGYHPWHITQQLDTVDFDLLEQCAGHPQVLAIGETGLDSRRGAPMHIQRQVFARHLSLAATLRKPVVIHSVKTAQQVLMLRRDLELTSVKLAFHGMRANEHVARMLLDEGCYLSYGIRFNPQALRETPMERLLIETDDADITIEEVAARVADQLVITADDVLRQTSINARQLLQMP